MKLTGNCLHCKNENEKAQIVLLERIFLSGIAQEANGKATTEPFRSQLKSYARLIRSQINFDWLKFLSLHHAFLFCPSETVSMRERPLYTYERSRITLPGPQSLNKFGVHLFVHCLKNKTKKKHALSCSVALTIVVWCI